MKKCRSIGMRMLLQKILPPLIILITDIFFFSFVLLLVGQQILPYGGMVLCVYCAKKTQLVPKKNLPKAMSAAKILFAKKFIGIPNCYSNQENWLHGWLVLVFFAKKQTNEVWNILLTYAVANNAFGRPNSVMVFLKLLLG